MPRHPFITTAFLAIVGAIWTTGVCDQSLTVNHNSDTGEYEIRIEVQDFYPSTWGSGVAGTGKVVRLYYKGIPQTL